MDKAHGGSERWCSRDKAAVRADVLWTWYNNKTWTLQNIGVLEHIHGETQTRWNTDTVEHALAGTYTL